MPQTIEIKTDSDIYSDINKCESFVWALVGENGSGTTTTAVQMCRDWKQYTPKTPLNYFRGKVVAFDPHGIFKQEGVVDVEINITNKNWAKDLVEKDGAGNYKYANSLVVLDDYRMLLSGNTTPADFLDLLMLKRKMGLSIIYITKNPKHILERLSYFTSYYSIFKTNGVIDAFSEKTPAYKDCKEAADWINDYIYIEGGKGTYPNFYHIIVKAVTGEFELRNEDK